jgi:hypothetical protein
VDGLRYILNSERDEYLPLRVIMVRLVRPAGPAAGGPEAKSAGPLSRRELLAAAGIDESQLADLETFGLIRRVGRTYGPDALEVASSAAALGKYGVEARHLRAVRAAVEREMSFIEQLVAPVLRQRKPEARQQAGQTAREIAAVTMRLHGALIEAALAEAGFRGDGLAPPATGYGHPAGGAGGDSA